MASELSQLIESELRKAEGSNKPDEHQRRLASLRVKTGLEKPPPGIIQRFCTPKRQIIAAAVVTVLVLVLIVAVAIHRRHTLGQGSLGLKSMSEDQEPLAHSTQVQRSSAADSSSGLSGGYEVVAASASNDDHLFGPTSTNLTSKANPVAGPMSPILSSNNSANNKDNIVNTALPTRDQFAKAPTSRLQLAPQSEPASAQVGVRNSTLAPAPGLSRH